MRNNLNPIIKVTPDGDEVGSKQLCEDQTHQLNINQNSNNDYVSLEFTSRRSMYDFAVSLLQEAVYGTSGLKEFYPLTIDGKMETIDGVRVSKNSSRLFITYTDR